MWVVVMIVGGMCTVRVNVLVALPAALVAWMVKVYDVVDVIGVPDMTPVVGFSVRPLGRLPLVMLHCTGMCEVAWRV